MDLYGIRGRGDEAVAEVGKWAAILGLTDGETRFVGIVYRGIADPNARAAAIAAIGQAGAGYPLYDRAKHFAMLGLLDRAFAVVDTMLAVRDEGIILAHGELGFKSLRSDPRWEDVSRRMGVKN
jgi:hypothetical protein